MLPTDVVKYAQDQVMYLIHFFFVFLSENNTALNSLG